MSVRYHGPAAVLLFLCAVTSAIGQIPVWHPEFSGQGISIGINPYNGNTVFAQGNDSRLNISRDGGSTWTATSTYLPFETREFIIHPNDTNTVFVVNFSDGLYRSTDGGQSFALVLGGYGIDGESVVYDPVHPDTMYAGNFGDASVYISTNRGQTWTLRGHAGTTGNLCTVAVRPDSARILYAGTGAGTISKSTDGGATWKQVKTGGSAEIPKIVIDPRSPMVAYAAAYAGDPNATGVWKSTDGGEHWNLTSLHNISMWSMDIDVVHPDTIYSGTFSEYGSAVYRSTDAGTTWSQYGRGFVPYNSLWNMKVDRQDGSHLYMAATHGDFQPDGVYRLVDASAGVEGFVVNGYNSQVISSGSVTVSPTSESFDLALSSGTYHSYRLSGDTSTARSFNVFINSTLFAQDTLQLVNATIVSHNIVVQPGSISGTLYNDLNNNGTRDGGEPGLAGWLVKLSGAQTGTATTDANGNYTFYNLFPGTYTVAEQRGFGWAQTGPADTVYTVTVLNATRYFTGKDFGNRTIHRVTAVSPAPYATVPHAIPLITATFDTAMDPSTFHDTSTVIVRGSLTGIHRGTISFGTGDTVMTFTPALPPLAGETVIVDVTGRVRTAAGNAIAPHLWQFTVEGGRSGANFASKVNYTVGSSPWGVTAGDLNNDGWVDVVTANSNGGNISVLMNNGDGTFATHVDYATGFTPRAVVLTDVNNDGHLDIAVANSGFSTVTVLLNDGSGNFSSRTDYSVGGSPSSVSAIDLRGNGFTDIVATISTNNAVSILPDTGSGFGAYGSSGAGTFPWWAATADLDGDGGADVVLVNSLAPSLAGVLLNTGAGTLAAPVAYQLPNYARDIIVTDLNGDGRPDLLTANSSSDNFSFLLQDAGGGYPSRVDIPTAHSPWALASGDLDGDGLPDVCVVNSSSNLLSVFRNLDGTSFTRTDYSTGSQPRGVAIADLNGDGTLDVVVSNGGESSVSVYYNAFAVANTAGWNMVSIPAVLHDYLKSAVYPSAISNAFRYQGGYETRDTLENGVGYWVDFDSTGSVYYPGGLITRDTIAIANGWNLIGSIGVTVPVDSVVSVPPAIVNSNYFSYNGSYQIAASLEPGQAYWVRASGAGSLILNAPAASALRAAPGKPAAASLPGASSLEVVDAAGHRGTLLFSGSTDAGAELSARAALPPLPPGGSFDVRFAGDRYAALADGRGATAFPLQIRGATFPIHLRWSTATGDAGMWGITVNGQTKLLDHAGSLDIQSLPGAAQVELAVHPEAEKELPGAYFLAQNYPNPFNPSTTISYGLPARSEVRLVMTDLLGRVVDELVNTVQDAGRYSVSWTAHVPSGVYFCRLRTSPVGSGGPGYEQTRKLVVLR